MSHTIDPITIPESLILSLVGFVIVFVGLIVLMGLIKIISALSGKAPTAAITAGAEVIVPVAHKSSAVKKIPAPGSSGECDLHSVDDRTAAMLMAVVADELKTPLNELFFISIEEIKEDKTK